MTLAETLLNKRSTIITKWRDLIINTYVADTQRFMKKEKNRFANPVGQTISENVEHIYDALSSGDNLDKISTWLDDMIRIRAIQNFKPSQAIGFMLQLRKIINNELDKNSLEDDEFQDDVKALEERIEDAALLAFDIYSQCRQKLLEIKVNETQRQVARMLEKANVSMEILGIK